MSKENNSGSEITIAAEFSWDWTGDLGDPVTMHVTLPITKQVVSYPPFYLTEKMKMEIAEILLSGTLGMAPTSESHHALEAEREAMKVQP